MLCAEIWLSTAPKAALNSDAAQNFQTLDNDDPISKMVGQRKAPRVAVTAKGATVAATTGQLSDGVAWYA